jgi:hypothetical protein
MMHYGAQHAGHAAAHYGNHNARHCARSVHQSLQSAFGPHHDLNEISNFVAQLCYGRPAGACRVLLRSALRTGALASEVPPPMRPLFRRAAMRGLRKGKCFKHQIERRGRRRGVRFGEDDENDAPAASTPPAFDPNAFASIFASVMGTVTAGIGAATEAENRAALAAAADAAGADAAANSDLLNQYAALLTSQQETAAAAANSGDAGEVERMRLEMERTQADLERKLAEATEGPSQLAVAGMVVGGLAVLGLGGWLISRMGGNANMHYGGMHDSYGDHCYGGHCN